MYGFVGVNFFSNYLADITAERNLTLNMLVYNRL